MNVFDVHRGVMGDYKSYIQSFINISDQRIKEVVDGAFEGCRHIHRLFSLPTST
jgi:hypothetical protein